HIRRFVENAAHPPTRDRLKLDESRNSREAGFLFLEFERELGQLGNVYVQCGRDALGCAPSGIGPAALDQGERPAGHTSLVCQGFLANASLFSELANRSAEGRLWLL